MANALPGIVSVAGRASLAAIFLLSAVGNKIPNFDKVAEVMGQVGVPAPRLMLVGAIAFLLVGAASVALGLYARFGAALLLAFLALASYYFHGFWRLEDAQAQQEQTIQFMKNLSMAGAMLFIIASGPGAWSLDAVRAKRERLRSNRESEWMPPRRRPIPATAGRAFPGRTATQTSRSGTPSTS